MKRYPALNEKIGIENVRPAISVLLEYEPILQVFIPN
jgi:hypothetical protein